MDNRCVCCGVIIPEGRLICPHCEIKSKEERKMKEYGIYIEIDYLDLVAIVKANNYEEAVTKARKLGYGKNYRVEELYD